jgi:Protein of unknown function (DUF3551)
MDAMEGLMRKLLLGAAAAAALMTMDGGKAQAAPYCYYIGGLNSYESCAYQTWEQCLLAKQGRGGFCMRNPHDPALWGMKPDDDGHRRARPRRPPG